MQEVELSQLLVYCIDYTLTLKMEVMLFSENWLTFTELHRFTSKKKELLPPVGAIQSYK